MMYGNPNTRRRVLKNLMHEMGGMAMRPYMKEEEESPTVVEISVSKEPMMETEEPQDEFMQKYHKAKARMG